MVSAHFERLKQKIKSLELGVSALSETSSLALGVQEIDACFSKGGLLRGALHKIEGVHLT